MNHSKINNSNCRFMDAAFTFVASFLHFGLICLFLLCPSTQSSTTASSSAAAAESPNSDSPSSSPPSFHRQFSDFFNESPSPLATQHQFEQQHPRRRIYVTRQFPIRYRRAREECTVGEMLQVEGVPLEMLNLMASFSMENEDLKMDEDLGELALGEEVLRLEGTKAEGKNCSAKNLGKMDEEWRRRKGKGKRKRPTEIKPGMSLEMRALCPFERVVNTDGHRLPKRIPEIRCICNRPPAQNDDDHQIHCEPLYRHIRVLKFEPNCKKFRLALQRISVGCVAAFKSRSSSEFDAKMGRPQNAQIEQAIR